MQAISTLKSGAYGYPDAYGYYDDEDDGGCYLAPGSSACDDAIRLAAEARAIKDECPPVHGGGLLR
jgi:hypothetical protein